MDRITFQAFEILDTILKGHNIWQGKYSYNKCCSKLIPSGNEISWIPSQPFTSLTH